MNRNCIIVVLFCCLLFTLSVFAGGRKYYLIGELGLELSAGTAFRDLNPEQQVPTPLYGPGYEAAGDFGHTTALALGLGCRWHRLLRTDFTVGFHPQFGFSGQSNFLNGSGPEPVVGNVKTVTGMAGLYLDLAGVPGCRIAGWAPYVGGRFGFAHNRVEPMTLSYPSLAVPHTLTTPGGTTTNLAMAGCVGVSRALLPRLTLDLGYRYTDFGDAVTAAGDAVRYRPSTSETKVIPIGETRAPLRAHGVYVGVRLGL